MKNRKNRKIWFVYGDWEATLLIICLVIVAVLFFFLFVGCTPTKKTLKQTITAQSEQIDELSITNYKLRVTGSELQRQKDSVSATISILENVSEYFENMYKNVSEKLAVNSWYKEYFESGQVKIESGSATEKNTERTENQNITQTINYKEKYFELIEASERQHSALLSYAYENDSLRQLFGNSEQVKIDTATSAKTGLNWWQKTQIIGFWVLIAGVGLVLGVRKFMKG